MRPCFSVYNHHIHATFDQAVSLAEPGVASGSDFKSKLKKNEARSPAVNLERAPRSGEQVDFRDNLKQRAEKQVINIISKKVMVRQIFRKIRPKKH